MPTVTAGTIMDQSAALMNDAAKSIYSYTIQIPYLNMALQELQEIFELNNVPVTDTITSSPIIVPINIAFIGFPPAVPIGGTPYLPTDLIEPKVVWERQTGVDPYVPMTKLDFLPRYMSGTEISQFIYYTWQSQEIRILATNQINDIKIDYIRSLFNAFTSSTDTVAIVNTQSFLEYRTAGLLAQFCAENPTRAQSLNQDAMLALDRSVGIGTKGRQAINTRHRPFRSSYKNRSYM
jgi:hypothetical protein